MNANKLTSYVVYSRVSGRYEEVKTHVNSTVVECYQISLYLQLFLQVVLELLVYKVN